MSENTTADKKTLLAPQSLLRVGFLGAANISFKNAKAIKNQNNSLCKLVAVASRSREKGESFIKKCIDNDACPKNASIILYENYKELVNSVNIVDAIYIPLPTTLHKEWVIKCLNSNKHVLLEKPVALSSQDYKEMQELARINNLFLMDGTMLMHHKSRTVSFLSCLAQHNIKEIKSEFTFNGFESFWKGNIRLRKDGDSLGCLGDLGWYCIRIAQLICCDKAVTSVQVLDSKCNEEGVPIKARCKVMFGEIPCTFLCSFLQDLTDFVQVITVDNKVIHMNNFVRPSETLTNVFEIRDLLSEKVLETIHCENDPFQQVLMWRNFSLIANGFEKDISIAGVDTVQELNKISFENQLILDALMKGLESEGETIIL